MKGSYQEAVQGRRIVIHTASPFIRAVRDSQRDLVDPAVHGVRDGMRSPGFRKEGPRWSPKSQCVSVTPRLSPCLVRPRASSGPARAVAWVSCGHLRVRPGRPVRRGLRQGSPSVAAQEHLSEHFPGGAGNPAVVIADADGDAAEKVRTAAAAVEGVDSATLFAAPGSGRPLVADGRVRIDVTLADAADSDAVVVLRATLHAVPGADALVGGSTAQKYDPQVTAERDRNLVVPVVLAIILVILAGLLQGASRHHLTCGVPRLHRYKELSDAKTMRVVGGEVPGGM